MNEATTQQIAARSATFREVSKSPFGPEDQIGMLNLMSPESRMRALAEADATRPFDLAVDYFVGMPSFTAAGDPPFQISLTHTPSGTVIDDPMGVGEEQNRLVGYSSEAISLYTHCGTHIDALNHFGYCGKIWNGYEEREHLGSRSWSICGVEQFPPIFARGVLIDVAGAHGLDCLPESHAIGSDDLRMALDRQNVDVRPGDVVLIRTGRMTVWPDWERYVVNEPGLNREGAEFLAKAGAMVIGADNLSLEQIPSADPENWQVVHTYLFAEAGVPIMEVVDLEELAREEVHEFAFIGTPMPIRGATGAPLRPVALPLRP
jgi:kynurenine formamidase